MNYEDLEELKPKNEPQAVHANVYRLGDKLGKASLTYWGQEKKEKSGNVSAAFVCSCGELFRSQIRHVVTGNTRSCGCIKRKKDK